MYKFKVIQDRKFIEGLLKDTVIHDYDACKFVERSAALLYAKADGSIVTPCSGNSAYIPFNSRVVAL